MGAVLFVRHHRGPNPATALQLKRIAARIMADGQSLARHETSIVRKRNRRRPLHGLAIAAEARFAEVARSEPSAARLNRMLALFHGFPVGFQSLRLGSAQPEIIILVI